MVVSQSADKQEKMEQRFKDEHQQVAAREHGGWITLGGKLAGHSVQMLVDANWMAELEKHTWGVENDSRIRTWIKRKPVTIIKMIQDKFYPGKTISQKKKSLVNYHPSNFDVRDAPATLEQLIRLLQEQQHPKIEVLLHRKRSVSSEQDSTQRDKRMRNDLGFCSSERAPALTEFAARCNKQQAGMGDEFMTFVSQNRLCTDQLCELGRQELIKIGASNNLAQTIKVVYRMNPLNL